MPGVLIIMALPLLLLAVALDARADEAHGRARGGRRIDR